jgi:hypothetical protein
MVTPKIASKYFKLNQNSYAIGPPRQRLKCSTQRATKGFSARNGPKVGYVISRNPPIPTLLPTVGPMYDRLDGLFKTTFEVRCVA